MTKNPPPKPKARNLPRGDMRYLIAAAALVAVVAVLALAFGIVRPPAVAGLTDAQRVALPGSVAWTEFNDRDGCTDLMVARPDGTVESIVCPSSLDRVIGWTGDGIVTISYTENGDRRDIRDPETGEVLSTRNLSGHLDQPKDEADDVGFTMDRVDGKLVLANRNGTVIWEAEADARYEIGTLAVSPDGTWVAMTDSAERLLVVRADGSDEPAIWATGVREWSWRPVTWEGTEPPS